MQSNNLFGKQFFQQKPQSLFQNINPTLNPPKKKLLCWSDCIFATTGFGVVSKHILYALYNTGKYDIDQLAINYFGDFYDKDKIPFCIVPARLKNPSDPYGNQMFLDAVQKKPYDYILIINDTFVVEGVAEHLDKIRQSLVGAGKKAFKVIYYYPVDCKLSPAHCTMIKIADRAVAYTNFAKDKSLEIGVTPTDIIYHGANTDVFKSIDSEQRELARAQYFNIFDPNTFFLININRNTIRKDMPRTILAFSEFRKYVPNSKLYLHCRYEDGMGGQTTNLLVAVQELGLNTKEDVLFPSNFNPAKGIPENLLNVLYNCGDAFISNHGGEGFGLTIVDSMSASVPVIVPNNTVTPELIGSNGDRGYVYECKEKIWVDNSGFRNWGRLEDIVASMLECYQDWKDDRDGKSTRRKEIIQRGSAFAQKYSWNNVCQQWIKLFDELDQDKVFRSNERITGDAL